jgi:protein-tyrosine phosphatase
VVASSANLAGRPPPLAGGDVLRDLNGRIDLLVDAGRTKYARASTIVEVTGCSYRLVREGVYDAGIVKRLAALRILFVCTGNTCRSPMAAGLARKMLADRLGCAVADLPAQGISVESAGVGGGLGGASDHAITVMTRRGIDIRDHRSRALAADLIRQADHVFTMTKSQLARTVDLEPASVDYASTLFRDEDVADPMGGSEDVYEQCARKLEEGLAQRLQEVPI